MTDEANIFFREHREALVRRSDAFHTSAARLHVLYETWSIARSCARPWKPWTKRTNQDQFARSMTILGWSAPSPFQHRNAFSACSAVKFFLFDM